MAEEDKKDEKKKSSWWKYAVGAYAADKVIDSKIEDEVDRRVQERFEELSETMREEEEQRRFKAKVQALKQTPQGRKLLAKIQNAQQFADENSPKLEELREQKEEASKLVQLYDNKVNYNAGVSPGKAVFLDIMTLGGAKFLYLKTELSKKVHMTNKKERLLSDTKSSNTWVAKIITIITFIYILSSQNIFETTEDRLGALLACSILIIWNLANTYKIARSLNDNYNNFESNKKELAKVKNNLIEIENEYEELEKEVVSARGFLDDFRNSL